MPPILPRLNTYLRREVLRLRVDFLVFLVLFRLFVAISRTSFAEIP
jgi:hypothetical protein